MLVGFAAVNFSVLQSRSSESVQGGGVPSAESDETLVAASPTLTEGNQTTVSRKTRGM